MFSGKGGAIQQITAALLPWSNFFSDNLKHGGRYMAQ
jgi:hypothetical protein